MRKALVSTLAILIVMASASAAPKHETRVGRLFFTPERRQALDHQRLLNIQETQSLQGSSLSLDGVVRRSTGKQTVWIKGRAQSYNSRTSGVSVSHTTGNPGQARVNASGEAPIDLKVGEAVNRATGEKDDPLRGGAVRLSPARK